MKAGDKFALVGLQKECGRLRPLAHRPNGQFGPRSKATFEAASIGLRFFGECCAATTIYHRDLSCEVIDWRFFAEDVRSKTLRAFE